MMAMNFGGEAVRESTEEDATFEDVLYQAIEAALEARTTTIDGDDFTGKALVEIFSRMSIDDERTGVLLALLATNEPVTGKRFLRVVESYGFAAQVEEARLVKTELARVGDVAVQGVGGDAALIREAAVPPPPLEEAEEAEDFHFEGPVEVEIIEGEEPESEASEDENDSSRRKTQPPPAPPASDVHEAETLVPEQAP